MVSAISLRLCSSSRDIFDCSPRSSASSTACVHRAGREDKQQTQETKVLQNKRGKTEAGGDLQAAR
jgi:hypothetical protein